jgi:signal transduction histidine kinase
MLSLLRRIALSVALALLVALAATTAFIELTNERKLDQVASHASGLGLRVVARELARVPREQRPARLLELSRDVDVSLRIVEQRGPRREDMAPRAEARRRGPPALVFQLDDAQALLADPRPGRRPMPGFGPPLGEPHGPPPGELQPPPFREHRPPPWERPPHARRAPLPIPGGPFFPLAPLLSFVALAVVGASLLVGVPLVRRLQAIITAIESLAEGRFDVTVQGPRGDALGAVAEALERTAARLRRLFSERVELLQAVSHEIGTPLSRMRFQLELLERAATPEERAKLSRALDAEVRELDELSAELISWVEADAAELRRAPLDASASLAQLVEVESLSCERPLAITLEAPAELAARVEPRQFLRAIENLLRNAVRYARAEVRVRARREGDALLVCVEDDGPGIPEQERERVFAPFVREDPARGRAGGAAGLGLAIVKRVVERHQGRVWIESSSLGGAAVHTRWPDGG